MLLHALGVMLFLGAGIVGIAAMVSAFRSAMMALRAEAFDRYSTGDAPSGTNVEWDTLGDAATALLELYPPDMKRE